MSGTKQRPGKNIDFSDLRASVQASATEPAAPYRPTTGVGLMSLAVAGARELQADNERLQAQVQQLEKERGAVLLDPHQVRPSRWANRHESSFTGPEFAALKTEIEDAGGNVQPVKVRPLAEPDANGARYELVFGHRRHRCCLELGLQVLAVVADVDEQRLWVEMEIENRGRVDLSPWEQGMMYRRALDAGLFASLRMLAQAIGASPGTVSKALSIADLPPEIVNAFARPADIQFRWAGDLRQALEQRRDAVLQAAIDLEPGLSAAQVFRRLSAAGVSPGNTPTDAEPGEAAAARVSPGNTLAGAKPGEAATAGVSPGNTPRRPDTEKKQHEAELVPAASVALAPAAGLLLSREDVIKLMAEADLQALRPGGEDAAALLRDVAERIARSLGEDTLAAFVRERQQRNPGS